MPPKGNGKRKVIEEAKANDDMDVFEVGSRKRPRRKSSSEISDEPPIPLDMYEDKDLIKAGRRKAGEEDSPNWPEGVNWYGVPKYLGGGAGGQAFLWLAVDENGAILDRICTKDCYVTAHQWKDINHWHGDPRNPASRVHMEIHIQQTIHDMPGSEHCVNMLHFETDDERMFYRLYLAYCAHGDLGDILRLYNAEEPAATGKKRKTSKKDLVPEEFIPEPFLWSVLESLTEACLLLDQGAVEDEDAASEWQTIVHRDMKTDNVYIDSPRESGPFPSYPHVILGDYGVAIMTSDDDPMNPYAYNGGDGTVGWEPPEMLPMADRTTFRPTPVDRLGSKTNVWGIGAIVVALMNKQEVLEGTSFKDGVEQPVLLNHTRRYSKELRDLVNSCTMYYPEDRIDLKALRQSIRDLTESSAAHDLAEGMRDQEHAEGDLRLTLKYHADDPDALGTLRSE